MKRLLCGGVVAVLLAVSMGNAAHAQTTVDSNSSSNASTSSLSGANVGNQGITGVNAVINQTGADHVSYDNVTKSQVPISVAGYGSFSQVSCYASVGGGATTRLFSFVYNGPKADVNCQHIVRGDAMGRISQLALASGDHATAAAAMHVAMAAYCTASPEARQDCVNAGLVQAVSKSTEHGKTVIEVAPVITGASPMTVARLNGERGFTTIDYSKLPQPPTTPQISRQQAPVKAAAAPSNEVVYSHVTPGMNVLPWVRNARTAAAAAGR